VLLDRENFVEWPRVLGQQLPQQLLSGTEWLIAKINPVEPQQIESGKGNEPRTPEQILEDRPSLPVERDDLAIQDRLTPTEHLSHAVPELAKPIERNVPPGADLASLLRRVDHSSETIVLRLEEPGGVVERLGPQSQADGIDGGKPAGKPDA
jgi:hypothetical protein